MIDFDDGAGLTEGGLRGQLLHRQDRSARHVQRVERRHDLHLGHRHRPLLDLREDVVETRQARFGRVEVRIVEPLGVPDHLGERGERLQLGDDVGVGVGIGLPALALDDPPGMTAARRVAGARDRLAELAIRILRVFLQRTVGEPLLIAELHAAEVEHRVLHRARDALAAAALLALDQGGQDAGDQVDAGPRIADLRAGHQRHAIDLTRR